MWTSNNMLSDSEISIRGLGSRKQVEGIRDTHKEDYKGKGPITLRDQGIENQYMINIIFGGFNKCGDLNNTRKNYARLTRRCPLLEQIKRRKQYIVP